MTVNVRTDEAMTSILWRRLRYMLTPQFDLYKNIAPHLEGLNVLEVGFGTGFGSVLLSEYAWRVDAIEPDKDAVNFAEQVLPIEKVSFMEGDITKSDELYADQYDAVVMVETLEHIADWRTALFNIHHELKDGGKLYMTARNRNADLRRNDLHEREWTAHELKRALGEFFLDVKLFDYTLEQEQSEDTHITPLIAVATKASPERGVRNESVGGHIGTRRLEGRAGEAHAAAGRKAVHRVDD